jgi:hypothetical protein
MELKIFMSLHASGFVGWENTQATHARSDSLVAPLNRTACHHDVRVKVPGVLCGLLVFLKRGSQVHVQNC